MTTYNIKCCCPSGDGGGGGGGVPLSLTTPLQLEVEDARVYNSGTLGQPEIFKFDVKSHDSSATEFGGPPTPYSYNASTGVITINRSQFEALFEGLDWQRVVPRHTRRPVAV